MSSPCEGSILFINECITNLNQTVHLSTLRLILIIETLKQSYWLDHSQPSIMNTNIHQSTKQEIQVK